jgi:hypothetical protein
MHDIWVSTVWCRFTSKCSRCPRAQQVPVLPGRCLMANADKEEISCREQLLMCRSNTHPKIYADQAFVEVVHVRIKCKIFDVGGSFWMERSSAPWVINVLSKHAKKDSGVPGEEVSLGLDNIHLYRAGESINITNNRSKAVRLCRLAALP